MNSPVSKAQADKGDTNPGQGASKLRAEPETNPGSSQAEGVDCP